MYNSPRQYNIKNMNIYITYINIWQSINKTCPCTTLHNNTMLAFGGSEVDGHLSDLLPNSQVNLTIITREINSLQQ